MRRLRGTGPWRDVMLQLASGGGRVVSWPASWRAVARQLPCMIDVAVSVAFALTKNHLGGP
eukprot:scaffold92277_cov18-Prasinocladus_malaysianus.AAC.1